MMHRRAAHSRLVLRQGAQTGQLEGHIQVDPERLAVCILRPKQQTMLKYFLGPILLPALPVEGCCIWLGWSLQADELCTYLTAANILHFLAFNFLVRP